MLKIRGAVMPSTLHQVRLWAERVDGTVVCGETNIAAGFAACRRVWFDPVPEAYPPAVAALERADVIVLGPGSLFTSVLAHLAVPEIAAAVSGSRGLRVYVCNVMTQPGETDGFCAGDHVMRVLEAVPGGVDVAVLHEGAFDPAAIEAYAAMGQVPVEIDRARIDALGVRVVTAPLADAGGVVRHSPQALAGVCPRPHEGPGRAPSGFAGRRGARLAHARRATPDGRAIFSVICRGVIRR